MGDKKYEAVVSLLLSKKDELEYTQEDEKLLLKLWDAYWNKKKGSRAAPEALCASLLWQHSSNNHLWEDDARWKLQNLAALFGVRPKTAGNTAGEIRTLLKIEHWDARFCQKEVAESNPLHNFVMLGSGAVTTRAQAAEQGLPSVPLKATKEDHYYEGMDFIEEGEDEHARRHFRKALEMDDKYVDAYSGMGLSYYWSNHKKSDDYFEKAYMLTKEKFPHWPERMEWAIHGNRQYLRAIHNHAIALWRRGEAEEALKLFTLMLKLNREDNQAVRYLVAAIHAGISWKELGEDDSQKALDALLEEQNKKWKFWKD